MKELKFYVYVWEDQFGNIFYVGKGTGNRYKCSVRNDYFNRKLKKLELSGVKYSPRIVKENITNEEALELEVYTIKKLKSEGVILTNLTDGGEGICGFRLKESTKDKIRQKALGRKVSEETRNKMKESSLTKPKTTSKTRKLLSEINRGEKNSASKVTNQLVRKIYDKIIEGYTNDELSEFVISEIGERVNADLYRTGERWNDIWKTHIISTLPQIKSCGKSFSDHGGKERLFRILDDISEGVMNTRQIADKYGFKDTNNVLSIKRKQTLKSVWVIYELQRLSKAQ